MYLKSLDLSQLSRTTDLSLPEIKELLALETLSLPKTMKVLYGGNVFGGNPNLKTIELNGNPNMVFENGVLYNAAKSKLLAICGGAKLTKYVAPSTLTSIAKDVFKHAVTLKEIDLSQSGVRTYSVSSGDQGFATCTALEKVILPSKAGSSFNITHMAGLATLKEIVVPENATYYMSEDGVLYDKAQSTVLIYPAGKEAESYTMPETVTKIQTVAFKNAVHLKSIDLTAGKLTYVYANAFNGCTNATISLLCDERGFYEDGSSVTLRENWNEGVKEVKYHARYYFFTLTVDGLKDGAVTSKNPTFTASATYGDDVAELEVKLNGTVVAASANGYTLNLAEGENTVTILASFGDESREYSYTLTKDSTSYLDWTLHEDGEKTGGELTFDVAAQNIDKESVRVDSLQLFVKTAADGDWRSVGDENCTIVYDADHLKADVSLYVSKLLNANGTFSLKVVMNGEELVVETCEYLKPSASLKTDIESSTPTVPATKDWTFTVSLNGAEDLPVDIKNRVEIWADCGRDGWENIRPDDWGFKIAYSADGTTATVTMNRQNMEWNMLGDFTEPFRMMIRVEAGGAVHVLFFEVE